MIDKKLRQSLTDVLRKVEQLFEATECPFPDVELVGMTQSMYAFRDSKLLFGRDLDRAVSEPHRHYNLGRAMAGYVYPRVNPALFQKAQDARRAFEEALQRPDLLGLEVTIAAEDFRFLSRMLEFVPFYAGLLFVDKALGTASADQMCRWLHRSFPGNDLTTQDLMRPAAYDAAILYALGERGENRLPRLSRVTTRHEYEQCVQDVGFVSLMLQFPELG
jgi:hypothetical protein